MSKVNKNLVPAVLYNVHNDLVNFTNNSDKADFLHDLEELVKEVVIANIVLAKTKNSLDKMIFWDFKQELFDFGWLANDVVSDCIDEDVVQLLVDDLKSTQTDLLDMGAHGKR